MITTASGLTPGADEQQPTARTALDHNREGQTTSGGGHDYVVDAMPPH